jgi:hypothetical protein
MQNGLFFYGMYRRGLMGPHNVTRIKKPRSACPRFTCGCPGHVRTSTSAELALGVKPSARTECTCAGTYCEKCAQPGDDTKALETGVECI